MIIMFTIFILFLLMIIFPIFVALLAAHSKSKPMYIKQSNTKDPRYFATSFKMIIDKAWESYDGSGTLKMSKDEEIKEADKVELSCNEICKCLIYAENSDFNPKQGIIFEKEIYAKNNATLLKIPMLRAISCMKDLTIGNGTRIVRWADAEGILRAYNNCDLGLSTTSGTKLLIGENCSFKRLFAPEIILGLNCEEPDFIKQTIIPDEVVISSETIHNIKFVDDDIVNENGILQKSIITDHDITVLGNIQVQGHITSHKEVKIRNNAIVHGNIFAEGNIFIGSNAVVLGVIFTQENIYISEGAIIGQAGKIKSIVARGNIDFENNCTVYGYICTEKIGTVCPKE